MRVLIISFNSTSHALRASKLLPNGQIIPTPRKISASCGLSIKIEGEKDNILSVLKEAGINWVFAGEVQL